MNNMSNITISIAGAFLCIAYLILLVIQIRDFEYNPETQESRKQELEKLMQDQETLRNSLCNGAMQLWGGAMW
ncbi:unnamed protein product [Camellia sinensis]